MKTAPLGEEGWKASSGPLDDLLMAESDLWKPRATSGSLKKPTCPGFPPLFNPLGFLALHSPQTKSLSPGHLPLQTS